MRKVVDLRPDVLLLDLEMPGSDGVTALQRLHELRTETRVIVFTAFDMMARRAAAASALGYLVLMRSMVPPPLVEEAPGVLPELPGIRMGIVAREDLDTKELAPLIAAFEAVLQSRE